MATTLQAIIPYSRKKHRNSQFHASMEFSSFKTDSNKLVLSHNLLTQEKMFITSAPVCLLFQTLVEAVTEPLKSNLDLQKTKQTTVIGYIDGVNE